MPDARQLREAAASAALAGSAVNPLSDDVAGPDDATLGNTWEQEGFIFELIDSPDGQAIKMMPVGAEEEDAIMITDPREIEFILSKRGELSGGGPEEAQAVPQEPMPDPMQAPEQLVQ